MLKKIFRIGLSLLVRVKLRRVIVGCQLVIQLLILIRNLFIELVVVEDGGYFFLCFEVEGIIRVV